jgi:hypothetical protein
MAPVLEGKSIGSNQKVLKKRAPDLENQESCYGPSYSPTQGFNLLSNQFELVPKKLDPGPLLKVGLNISEKMPKLMIECMRFVYSSRTHSKQQ